MEKYIRTATITQPFGIKGEMKIYPYTDEPQRFKKLKSVFIEKNGTYTEYEIESAKMALPLVIIKLKGIETPEEVRPLRQSDIYVLRENATPLKEGEYYYADILGMEAFDEDGKNRGKVTDIIETGANDVYEITGSDGKSFLLPSIKDCILNIDLENNRMKIHILEGLLD